jgi:hypothetical protein
MRHLSRAELVELIEQSPALSADRVHHAATCPQCRAERDALQPVLARCAEDDVPEPSPLFWDHFSTRVADAVRQETPRSEASAGRRWMRSPVTSWAIAGTMALLLIVTVVWRTTLYAPVHERGVSVASGADGQMLPPAKPVESVPVPPDLGADSDAAWAIVRAAADDLPWDEVHAAGLTAGPDAAEGLALEMTVEERAELALVVGEELKRNGA